MKLHMQVLIALGLGIKRNGHIFFGLIAGIILGIIIHSHRSVTGEINNHMISVLLSVLTFIGQAFIRLIQMVVIPLVFSAIIVGISSIGDNKQLGKFGSKMILYYGIITVLAAVLGAILAIGIKPGIGAQHYINQTSAVEIQAQVHHAITEQRGNISQIFLNLIPQNPLESLSKGDMIPIIFFVLVFAIALAKVGEINRPVVSFFESIFAATMKVTDWIMYLAAPGIFALTAVAVSSFGASIFDSISKYFLVLLLGFGAQLFIIYPLLMKIFSKVPILTFYTAITEAMMVAFGTASSSATLPLTIACCEKRGISHKVCSFVLPLGATLNMDATALFQVVAVFFLTQAYGVTLEPIQIIQVIILAIIASSTCAGIPGAGLITIALVLNGLGLTPHQLVEGFAFLFAMERIVDMLRTMVNVTSDAVVAAVIADNENEINYDLLNNPESYKEII
ncbi:MAG: dicarboxylate/amino acid:cation symporter [Candidatus Gastranaerophilales bacterium]|nr:dicarboxylate/amino acid:cation symporter [Candidatus Gastranaerophilales bacterium]